MEEDLLRAGVRVRHRDSATALALRWSELSEPVDAGAAAPFLLPSVLSVSSLLRPSLSSLRRWAPSNVVVGKPARPDR